jgi:hypothetical protein
MAEMAEIIHHVASPDVPRMVPDRSARLSQDKIQDTRRREKQECIDALQPDPRRTWF